MKNNTHAHTLSHETTNSAGFMKENPGKASLAVPTGHVSVTESGTGWSVNSGSMQLTSHGLVWTGAAREHTHTAHGHAENGRSVLGVSYHVGDERGPELPSQEVAPVDGCEKGMFLQLRLNTC